MGGVVVASALQIGDQLAQLVEPRLGQELVTWPAISMNEGERENGWIER